MYQEQSIIPSAAHRNVFRISRKFDVLQFKRNCKAIWEFKSTRPNLWYAGRLEDVSPVIDSGLFLKKSILNGIFMTLMWVLWWMYYSRAFAEILARTRAHQKLSQLNSPLSTCRASRSFFPLVMQIFQPSINVDVFAGFKAGDFTEKRYR